MGRMRWCFRLDWPGRALSKDARHRETTEGPAEEGWRVGGSQVPSPKPSRGKLPLPVPYSVAVVVINRLYGDHKVSDSSELVV